MSLFNSGLRLAIISTPRSGYTWLRLMLQEALELEPLPVHHVDDCPWHDLPPRLLLGIHWHRTADFQGLLARHRFRTVGIYRHPLDTLISILHVSLHDVQSHRWLNGEGGNEDCIVGAMPRSQAFLDYATGPRAAALFEVNLEWYDYPGRFNVRYENLVANTVGTLNELFESLKVTPRRKAEVVAAHHTVKADKELHHGHGHFWKGQPGLWRALLCAPEAELLARAQARSFQRFGYLCDPDPALTPALADRNWIDLIREEQKRVRAEAVKGREDLEKLRREMRQLTEDYQRLLDSQQTPEPLVVCPPREEPPPALPCRWDVIRQRCSQLTRAFGLH